MVLAEVVRSEADLILFLNRKATLVEFVRIKVKIFITGELCSKEEGRLSRCAFF